MPLMEIKNTSIADFLDALASRQATPGGGSAAAIMGAQAAALISMAANLTLGKPKYADVEPEMRQLVTESEALRAQLTQMIKADSQVFAKLMLCYGLPKTTDAQQQSRSVQIQTVLKEATLVPLECARACAKTIALSQRAAQQANRAVVSDVGVAVLSGYGGLKGAALTVYINTESINDSVFVERKLAELESILYGTEEQTEAIYQLVKHKL